MTVQGVGTTFPQTYQWGKNEKLLVENIKTQIQASWPGSKNLLINTTWFGPQFNNAEYQRFVTLCNKQQFDNLFLLASVDPVGLTEKEIQHCKQLSGAKHLYLLGNFETPYQFNFISTLLPEYFETYSDSDLLPTQFKHVFLNYNRKPHPHRAELVDLLEQYNLMTQGVVTLGNRYTLNEQPTVGNWGMPMNLRIPHDIHTLGQLDVWRTCFLNVVSETINLPWDPLFITEKTFKPMLGLRPFIINGQSKAYQWLRDQGFKTFNHYWPHVDIENATELNTSQCIVEVIKYLSTQQLNTLYQQMLPDLLHNRQHFLTFAQNQQYKINNLF